MNSRLPNLSITAALLGGLVGASYGAASPAAPGAARAEAKPAPAARTMPRAAVVARQAARAVIEGVGGESGLTQLRVQKAVDALHGRVTRLSDPKALQLAFTAYYRYQESHPEKVRKPFLYFVDYGLGSSTPRGYVFDMVSLKLVDGPFTVAHGRGSAATSSGIPTRFSNREGSAATSLGLYLAQETYAFRGKTGGQAYRSVGLRLTGVSGKYNSRARARGVVVHGAPYVTAAKAGRSEGCPAMEPGRAARLIPRIARGGMVFLFSPRDREWVAADPWTGLARATDRQS